MRELLIFMGVILIIGLAIVAMVGFGLLMFFLQNFLIKHTFFLIGLIPTAVYIYLMFDLWKTYKYGTGGWISFSEMSLLFMVIYTMFLGLPIGLAWLQHFIKG